MALAMRAREREEIEKRPACEVWWRPLGAQQLLMKFFLRVVGADDATRTARRGGSLLQ